MHLDKLCLSTISPELKKLGSFPLTHSSTDVTTSSSDQKWHPLISFFKFGNSKKSLGATVLQVNRQDVVLIHTCFALQHPLQLCKCGLSWCHVATEHLKRVYLHLFHGRQFKAGLASLHLASRWLCLELLWPRGPRPYPLTTLSFNSLANNNKPKSHLQSPDAKDNHLLTQNASMSHCILML